MYIIFEIYTIIVLKMICTLKIYKVFENCGIKNTYIEEEKKNIYNILKQKMICIYQMYIIIV